MNQKKQEDNSFLFITKLKEEPNRLFTYQVLFSLSRLNPTIFNTIFYEIFKLGGETIQKETNGLIKDLHFGETAHKIMGDLFFDHIKNNEVINCESIKVDKILDLTGAGDLFAAGFLKEYLEKSEIKKTPSFLIP